MDTTDIARSLGEGSLLIGVVYWSLKRTDRYGTGMMTLAEKFAESAEATKVRLERLERLVEKALTRR